MKMDILTIQNQKLEILQANSKYFLINDKNVVDFSSIEKLICYLINYYGDDIHIKDMTYILNFFERG